MIKAKKSIGQHFLIDDEISQNIVNLVDSCQFDKILEVGGGTGMLTKYLIQKYPDLIYVMDIDDEAIAYMKNAFKSIENRIIKADILRFSLNSIIENNEKLLVIGNLPYYISSQILFKIIDDREIVPSAILMLQKEVAERVCSSEGSRKYGIISIFVNLFFETEYIFTVDKSAFDPIPKVQSAVIKLTNKNIEQLDFDYNLFRKIVKTAFNQRRKTLRNALKSLFDVAKLDDSILQKRAEQLSIEDYIKITKIYEVDF